MNKSKEALSRLLLSALPPLLHPTTSQLHSILYTADMLLLWALLCAVCCAPGPDTCRGGRGRVLAAGAAAAQRGRAAPGGD
jgi:hypothetical protein